MIFFARALDVSIGTVRIIVLSKGKKLLAPLLGFFELLIWLIAIRQIFMDLSNPFYYIAYAGGFAVGTYVGMVIEEKLAIGHEVIRIITRQNAQELIGHLKESGFGVTSMKAQGSTGDVHIIFTITRRSMVPQILSIIKEHNPKAFYTIGDVRTVQEGEFHRKRRIKK